MIRLLLNAYIDPDPARNAELRTCLEHNCGNPAVGDVHTLGGRPTFANFFAEVNDVTGPRDVNVLCNADVYFDETILLAETMGEGEAFALTRWDDTPGGLRHFADERGVPRCDSMDCWIFRGAVRAMDAEFPMGVRGCDNRIAAEMHRAGYAVANPSKSIRAIHLHRTDVRRYGHEPKDMVPKPYLLIDPHRLGDRPNYRWCL